jgi:hypothetical protein
MHPNRRRALALATAAAALWPALAHADAHRYAVLSLLADKFDVVNARPEVGSHLERNRRQTFEDPGGAFDRYAAGAVERALMSADSSTKVTLLSLPTTSRLYDQPDRIFDGKTIALPGTVVDALIAAKANRLVLITKHRGETRVPLVDGATGTGAVRGLGFYVDTDLHITRRDTGESSFGVLAPFVYLRLSLVDVESGEIVRERLVRAMATYFPAGKPGVVHPWDALNAEQKVDALRRLLERELERAVPTLLQDG